MNKTISPPCPSDYRKGDEDDPRSPYYEEKESSDDFNEPDEHNEDMNAEVDW